MPKQYDDCTWIGLFGVTGPPDNVQLQGCLGAYVTALAVADDERRFAERVAKNLADIGLESGEIVWSELLKERLRATTLMIVCSNWRAKPAKWAK